MRFHLIGIFMFINSRDLLKKSKKTYQQLNRKYPYFSDLESKDGIK